MKIGDLLIDKNENAWIIYDLSIDRTHAYVVDLKTHAVNEYVQINLFELQEKPSNVEHLFIKRREKNLRGLEMYFGEIK